MRNGANKIISVILAALLCAFCYGCAAKPTDAQALSKILSSLLYRTQSVSVTGTVTDGLIEEGEKTKNINGTYPISKEVAIDFSNSGFIDFILTALNRSGAYSGAVSKEKGGYVFSGKIEAKQLADKIVIALIQNIDKPTYGFLNEVIKLFLGDVIPLEETINKLYNLDVENLTAEAFFKEVDKIIQSYGINIKTLTNTFISKDILLGDGNSLNGITIYDTVYDTIIKSFGKLKFLTVAGALLGGQPMTTAYYRDMINSFSTKLQAATWVFLSDILMQDLSALVAVKQYLSPATEDFNVSLRVACDKNYNILSAQTVFSIKLAVNIAASKINLIDLSGDLALNFTAAAA